MLSKNEFYKLEQNKSIRTIINIALVMCYVSLVATIILVVVDDSGPIKYLGMLDAVLVLVLTLLIQLKRNFVAALIFAVYSVGNAIMLTIENGKFTGSWAILAAILAVLGTWNFKKAWEEYQRTNGVSNNAAGNMYQNYQMPAGGADPYNQQYGHQANQQYNQPYGQQANHQYSQQTNQQYGQQYNQQTNQQYGQQYNQQANQQYGQQYNQQANQQYGQQYNQQANQQYNQNYGQQYSQQTNPQYGNQYNQQYVEKDDQNNGNYR